MTVGRNVDRGGHVAGFVADIERAAAISEDAFFTWFNDAKSARDALAKGEADFVAHVLEPLQRFAADFNPSEHIALEIGYGGGRPLAAASRRFERVVGIDIHGETDRVARMLKEQGIDNFELLRTDGNSIPQSDASVDFAYSFIVLQHVELISVFRRYIEEVSRVLRPGGRAVLYFGRFAQFSYCRRLRLLLWLDRVFEPLMLRGGYREAEARVNCTNLFITMRYATGLCRDCGLEVDAELVSYRIDSRGARRFGGQNGLLVRRL